MDSNANNGELVEAYIKLMGSYTTCKKVPYAGANWEVTMHNVPKTWTYVMPAGNKKSAEEKANIKLRQYIHNVLFKTKKGE